MESFYSRLQSFGVIFDSEAWLDLSKVIDVSNRELIHQGTVYGFDIATFEARCAKKSPTLVLFKLSFGAVIGGYTSTPWTFNGLHQQDLSTFLVYRAVGGHVQTIPLIKPGHKATSVPGKFAFGGTHCVLISLSGAQPSLSFHEDLGHLGIGTEAWATDFEVWHLPQPKKH